MRKKRLTRVWIDILCDKMIGESGHKSFEYQKRCQRMIQGIDSNRCRLYGVVGFRLKLK